MSSEYSRLDWIFDYQTKDPEINFVSLIGDFSADYIITQIQNKIQEYETKIESYNKERYKPINAQAKNQVDRTRLKTYNLQLDLAKQRKIELDKQSKNQAIIDSRNLQFQKNVSDIARINLVNLSADKTRIDENYKKYLGLGILGAALLG